MQQRAEALLAESALKAMGAPMSAHPVEIAVRHVIDSVGVSIAGARGPTVQTVISTLDGPSRRTGAARTLGTGHILSARSAAVANAMAGHLHDFDDDDAVVAVGHPTVVVFNAALAVAEAHDLDTLELIRAYVVGVEVVMRLGMIANPQHFQIGWHATTTLGVFGAAVACGLLMKLSAQQIENALGIAASLASGLIRNFGSEMKPLQVGHAAGDGVWAAQLAAGGIRPSTDALLGDRGFLRLTGAQKEIMAPLAGFGNPFGLRSPGFNIKIYPCCSSNHSALDALLGILRSEHPSYESIKSVDAWIGRDAADILVYDVPQRPSEAKFSLRYCLAVAARRGAVTLDDFTERAIADPELARAIAKVRRHVDPGFKPAAASGVTHEARVRVETEDGRVFERHVHEPRGGTNDPVSSSELKAKFLNCSAAVLSDAGAARAFCKLERIADGVPTRELINALCAAGTA